MECPRDVPYGQSVHEREADLINDFGGYRSARGRTQYSPAYLPRAELDEVRIRIALPAFHIGPIAAALLSTPNRRMHSATLIRTPASSESRYVTLGTN